MKQRYDKKKLFGQVRGRGGDVPDDFCFVLAFFWFSDKSRRTQPQQRSELVKGDALRERAVLSVRASRNGEGGDGENTNSKQTQ